MSSLYDFSFHSLYGEALDTNDYRGKLVLIVNTASKCGLTPQYEGLEELHQKYKDQGLVILGFPCNQFGNQEPGDANEIKNSCLINYGVTFQMCEKINVNGKETHPLYAWLKKECGGLFGSGIKWNFTKFFVDKNGKAIKRFAPTVTPKDLEAFILEHL